MRASSVAARGSARALVCIISTIAFTVVLVSSPRRAGAEDAKPIAVDLSSSTHLRLGQAITRVSVGSTDVADVAAFPPDQILITGKRVGQTTATVWFRNDDVSIYTIQVEYPTRSILATLARAFPTARDLQVTPAGATVVVTGQVATVTDVESAGAIVRGLLGNVEGVEVVNLLTVPGDQQVQLEVSFAEVQRSALREIGINFFARDKNGDWAGGLTAPSNSLFGIIPSLNNREGADGISNPTGLPFVAAPLLGNFGAVFATEPGSKFPFSAALSILGRRGYARTLSEPTLVALSGQEASFLAGGEFPIAVPQALGQNTVEFKQFGVQLRFLPTVVADTIQLKLATTVSDVDQSLGIVLAGTRVPGLSSKSSETVVRLRDGQSFAIAGLLSDTVRSTVDKVPGLGDLPVLGALFRSTSYRRDESELLVVVTARLVRPQGERPVLPGEDTTTDPGDLELFLLGTYDSQPTEGWKPRAQARQKPVGKVGFAR